MAPEDSKSSGAVLESAATMSRQEPMLIRVVEVSGDRGRLSAGARPDV